MTAWGVAVVTLLYAYTSWQTAAEGEYAWATVWFAYALANVGLIAAMRGY